MTEGKILADRFEVFRELGEGTSAHTYLALEHSPNNFKRLARLKILKSKVKDNPKLINRIFRSARILGAVNSANILRVYAIHSTQGQTFIASPYSLGESLLSILAQCTTDKSEPPIDACLYVIRQAAKGIASLHLARGKDKAPALIHHGLHPGNILVDYDGHTQVCDAGLGLLPIELMQTNDLSVGLAQFLAPELFTPKKTDQRADIYALASSLYVILTLRFPYDEQNLKALIRHKTVHECVPAHLRRTDIPKELSQLLSKALSPDPAERIGEVEEFIKELDDCSARISIELNQHKVAKWIERLFVKIRTEKLTILQKIVFQDFDERYNEDEITEDTPRLPRAIDPSLTQSTHVVFGPSLPTMEVSAHSLIQKQEQALKDNQTLPPLAQKNGESINQRISPSAHTEAREPQSLQTEVFQFSDEKTLAPIAGREDNPNTKIEFSLSEENDIAATAIVSADKNPIRPHKNDKDSSHHQESIKMSLADSSDERVEDAELPAPQRIQPAQALQANATYTGDSLISFGPTTINPVESAEQASFCEDDKTYMGSESMSVSDLLNANQADKEKQHPLPTEAANIDDESIVELDANDLVELASAEYSAEKWSANEGGLEDIATEAQTDIPFNDIEKKKTKWPESSTEMTTDNFEKKK